MDTTTSETENRKHILCLDDDEDTCAMMDALLKTYGYEVTTAGSVAKAQGNYLLEASQAVYLNI
jgi:CheY-like chemotaxis protein